MSDVRRHKELKDSIQREFSLAIAREEQKLDKFNEYIKLHRNSDIFKDIELPEEITLKEMCPELYKENPDISKYAEEFERLESLIAKIDNIILAYNEEGVRCLQDFNQMN